MASNPGSPNPSATGDTNIHTNIPPRPHNDNGGEGSAPSSPSKVDAEKHRYYQSGSGGYHNNKYRQNHQNDHRFSQGVNPNYFVNNMQNFNPRNPKQSQRPVDSPQGAPAAYGYPSPSQYYSQPASPLIAQRVLYPYTMYSPGSQPIHMDTGGLKPSSYVPPARTHRSVKITNPLTNEPVLLSKPADTPSPVPSHASVTSNSPAPGSPSTLSVNPSRSRSGSSAESTATLDKKNEFKELIKQRALDAAKQEEATKKVAEEKAKLEQEEAERKLREEEEEKVRLQKEAEAKELKEKEAAAAAEAAATAAAAAAKEAELTKAVQEPVKPSKPEVDEETIQAALASVNDRIKGAANPVRSLEKASRPSQTEIYDLKYPTGIISNEAKSKRPGVFTYDISFLLQFQNVINFPPKEHWDEIRNIMNFDKNSGNNRQSYSRSGSTRGGFPQAMGSFGTNFRVGDRTVSGPNLGSSFHMSGIHGKNMNRMSSSNLNGMNNMGPSKSGRQNSSRRGGRNDRSTSNRGERQGTFNNANQSSHASAEPEPPAAPVAPLVRSANAWVPRTRAKVAEEESGKLAPEVVQRKVKALLNKMTLENFDIISDQLLEISAQSKDEKEGRTLRQVLELTFAKAVDEAHWSNMYARFCAKMLNKIDPEISDEQIKDSSGNLIKGGALFRKYLLNRCQEEFERGWSDQLPTNEDGSPMDPELMSDEYYAAVGAKRRGLGLIRFIGELYFLGMLSEKIMHTCMQRLLSNDKPSEEVVESVCQLMTTVGSRLEQNRESSEIFNVYFQRLRAIQNTPGLPSRLRFMIMDVIDLRAGGWVDKRSNKGPKTIAEIHEEARVAKEKADAHAAATSHRGGRFPRPNASNNNTNRVSRDELDRLKSFRTISPNKFGPSSMFNRENSSHGGGSSGSRKSSIAGSPSAGAPTLSSNSSRQSSQRGNVFAVLADGGEKTEEKEAQS